jgi:multidrug efflux pump subunit AcrA (membrane-fusion protein)
MQLVPNDDELVVEARIKQRDIDNLQDVTNVQVRLTSFNQRFTHPINAKLISVSDSVVEGRGEPHYRAIVHLDKESLESIIPDAQLRSGMPAMTMIGVGQQSLLSYIVEPLFLSFYLALREPS